MRSMNLPLTGGCLCGALHYEISETPVLTHTCHCTDCQRLTSSAFSLSIIVPEGAFRLTGEPWLTYSTADSGRPKTRYLCRDCGCWICGPPHPGATPEDVTVRRVRAGTLDDTSWLRPTAHFWTRSKQPWVVLPEGDQIFEMQAP
jgi:hypothetical protein